MFFKQLKRYGDNFSYVIADLDALKAAVVDPSYNAEQLEQTLLENNLQLKYIIDTHDHQDHTAGNDYLLSKFKAKLIAHKLSKIHYDVSIEDGEVLYVGRIPLKVIYTPGHTTDSICLLVDNQKLLTGDTLFVGECGRTDLPGGSSKSLYESFKKLLKLNDRIEVYPGHDYGSTPSSTIATEKKSNYTLQPRTQEQFVAFMSQP